MNYADFKSLTASILENDQRTKPYDNEVYFHSTRMNHSRMRRWDKNGVLDENLAALIRSISQPLHWIIITEPWCGDAAHTVPFLIKMTELNPLFTYELQLRDSEPHLIENYLTNGGKSIPKVIVRDHEGNDLFTWGPRPEEVQNLRNEMKRRDADYDSINIALQHWYNQDKGQFLCKEMEAMLSVLESSGVY